MTHSESARYINDFSKALAGEVRILLQEVGKLRDERRQLQQYVFQQLLPACPADQTAFSVVKSPNSWR